MTKLHDTLLLSTSVEVSTIVASTQWNDAWDFWKKNDKTIKDQMLIYNFHNGKCKHFWSEVKVRRGQQQKNSFKIDGESESSRIAEMLKAKL